MGKRIIYVYIAVLLFSCSQENKTTSSCNINEREFVNIQKLNSEYLDFREGLINDSTRFSLSMQEAEKAFKGYKRQISKITDFNKIYYYCYFNGLKFRKDKDDLYLEEVFFRNSEIFVKFPTITLSHKTLIGDVMNTFPESGKMIRGGGNTFHGNIILRTTKSNLHYGAWYLYFADGHLVKMILIDS